MKTNFWLGFKENIPLISFISCYTILALSLSEALDLGDKIALSLYFVPFLISTLLFLFLFLCSHAIYVMLFVRPIHLIRYICYDLRTNYLTSKRFFHAMPILVFLPISLSVYTSLKNLIPVFNPYCWDESLARVDSLLHGGVQPWQLLQPVVGHAYVTALINDLYNIWLLLFLAIPLWQMFSMNNNKIRTRFFLTYLICCALLGNGLATIFSSVGPCFYGRVTGVTGPFCPLMDYLWETNKIVPIQALAGQEYLWTIYERGILVWGSGISAMPSVHVSMAFLYVLLTYRRHPIAFWAFCLYALLIMIGSIHLGWHYAVDGYVAIPCTWIIWWIIGKLQKQSSFSHVGQQ